MAPARLHPLHFGGERIEPPFPKRSRAELAQVRFELRKRLQAKLVNALLAASFVSDKAGQTQHAQVAAHGGSADGELFRDCAGRDGPPPKEQ